MRCGVGALHEDFVETVERVYVAGVEAEKDYLPVDGSIDGLLPAAVLAHVEGGYGVFRRKKEGLW